MKTSIKGLVELAGLEGVCLQPYLDSVGVVTIGVGATRSEIPGLSLAHRDITVAEAIDLFKTSIVRYENAVNKALSVPVTQEQFDALTSICYNIGVGGLAKSTFIKRINANDTKARIAAAIMMWNKPKEIMGRRAKEAKLFTEGVYSNGGKALLFPADEKGRVNYSKGKTINIEDYL
jgi:lysozyme